MKKVIAEFELTEDQEKIIELDTSGLQAGNVSILQVQIVDNNGIPVSNADVWLERDGKEIKPYMNSDTGIIFTGAEGDYMLHAVHPGYKEVSVKVKLEAADIKTTGPKNQPMYIRLESTTP